MNLPAYPETPSLGRAVRMLDSLTSFVVSPKSANTPIFRAANVYRPLAHMSNAGVLPLDWLRDEQEAFREHVRREVRRITELYDGFPTKSLVLDDWSALILGLDSTYLIMDEYSLELYTDSDIRFCSNMCPLRELPYPRAHANKRLQHWARDLNDFQRRHRPAWAIE